VELGNHVSSFFSEDYGKITVLEFSSPVETLFL
jgi:hypothetical protein